MRIQELIGTIKAETGDTYDRFARRGGEDLTAARIHQLHSQEHATFSKPSTMRALARAFGVTERQVVLAMAESVGLDVATRDPALVALLPRGVEDLTDQQMFQVLRLIRALLLSNAAAAEAAAASPDTSPIPLRPKARTGT